MMKKERRLGDAVRACVRDVSDFPKKGIVFKDITPVLRDGVLFRRVCAALAAYGRRRGADLVLGVEARGFIFGAGVAQLMGCGFVPVRKKGKLPWKTVHQTYALEYGTDTIEMHRDAVEKRRKVLVVDDVLATGGTLEATCRLVRKMGGVVAGCACVLELGFLNGRRRLKGVDFLGVVTY